MCVLYHVSKDTYLQDRANYNLTQTLTINGVWEEGEPLLFRGWVIGSEELRTVVSGTKAESFS